MLDNSVKREGVKAVGAAGALVAADPIAASLSIVLGIAVESMGYLSKRRTRELFDSSEFIERIQQKINESDNFASFVFGVWQKHNLESSEQRRAYLKAFLEKESQESENSFENFSKIEYIIQNASLSSLSLLKAFHSKYIYGRPVDQNDARSRLTSITDVAKGIQEYGLKIPPEDLEYRINELCNYDLIAVTHGTMDGPFYNQTKLGFILLEYIEESSK